MNRKMIALIVGNSEYQNGGTKLTNAVNDANDMATNLNKLGFKVIKHVDCNIVDLDDAVSSFQSELNNNDVGLFYFAGHGIQIEGENYITSVDSVFTSESSVRYSSYALNRLIEAMDSSSNKTNLIILDACRDNPCQKGWGRTAKASSLAPMFAPKGTLIAYSTSPGETASDGIGKNGAYTESLLKHINKPDITIEDVFKKVRNSLSVVTQGKQTSWEHTSLTGDFYFNLSLGNRIDKYSKRAIADELYVLDSSIACHKIISELKTHNWYNQNPAINNLSPIIISKSDDDTLFVLGRNIYQAACGDSSSAIEYLKNFKSKVNGVSISKQICMIEGMLFEIFFNTKGDFRDSFKVTMFNTIFELDIHPDFKPAFDFIAELLVPFSNSFYIIPGKSIDDVAIELVTKQNSEGEILIKQIYFDGENILYGEKGSEKFSEYGDIFDNSVSYRNVVDKISTEMMIPRKYLSLQSNIEIDDNSKLKLPFMHSVKRS